MLATEAMASPVQLERRVVHLERLPFSALSVINHCAIVASDEESSEASADRESALVEADAVLEAAEQWQKEQWQKKVGLTNEQHGTPS